MNSHLNRKAVVLALDDIFQSRHSFQPNKSVLLIRTLQHIVYMILSTLTKIRMMNERMNEVFFCDYR